MSDGEMRGRAETENRLHNTGAAQRWDRRLPGELPDTHLIRSLGRAVKKGWRWVRHRRGRPD